MQARLQLKRTLLAQALCSALSTLAMPVFAGIVTLGAVNPDPSSGTVAGGLAIGNSATGSVRVDGGSSLRSDQLWLGTRSAAGDGALTVTGSGSRMEVSWAGGGNLDLGQIARGAISVLDGASFAYGDGSAGCQLSCRVFVSNAAGSEGSLLINGAGSSFLTPGGVVVGNASVFRIGSGDTLDFGTPGASSRAAARVEAGAAMSSSFLSIGQPGGGLGRTGTETSTGNVVVDGAGSVWNLVRNAAQLGSQALLRLANGANTSGSLEVRNGGLVKLDSSGFPSQQSGINMGVGAGAASLGASSSITVSGAGSRLELEGGIAGFFNLGRGTGQAATVNVLDGGVITGTTESGLAFMTIGRGGATGTANVSGTGSLLRLAGQDAAGAGAFLNVGRFDVTSGTGTLNIAAGGRVEIDTRPLVLSNPAALTGMIVGNTAGSIGTFNITGAGSTMVITGGSGLAPYVGFGRDGGSANVTISRGGRLEMSSSHVSALNPGGTGYTSGEAMFIDIGRRFTGSDGMFTTGVLTVTGAGSEVAMTGSADRLLNIGRSESSAGANGTLNLLAGGTLRSTTLLAGQGTGGVGTLNMNGGRLFLEGDRLGGSAPGAAGLSIGRDGGVGVANIAAGSVITIGASGSGAALVVGGSSTAPGGTGTMSISGGSTVSVVSPDAIIAVGGPASASLTSLGTLSMSGTGSSLSVSGSNARVVVGTGIGSIGTLSVGAGTTLNSANLIGVAHNGTASTGAVGTLVVNGTANAKDLVIGTTGLLSGSGVINADVTNHGTIKPGSSPGRLTFNGAFDSSDGRIELEVQSLGGGLFSYDEIVFDDPGRVTMGLAAIDFVFLGETDPTAFLTAGLFDLATFFKQLDASGDVIGLDDKYRSLFSSARFAASADRYVISGFAFDPFSGATFSAVAIPVPPSIALVLLGLMAMAGVRVRRQAVL